MTKSQKKIKGGGEQTFRLLVILLILSVLWLVFSKYQFSCFKNR